MKNIDVTALGELLIDFTMNGESEQGNPVFEANPGGAPCNVLALLGKHGKSTEFIGKVGKDQFGEQLAEVLKTQNIGIGGLCIDPYYNTTLAFVKTFDNGDRDFSFYRKPGADMMLTKEDVNVHKELIENTKIFHFGTLSMTHEGVCEATKYAIGIAKEKGTLISFDPNLRPPLWDTLENAKKAIEYGLSVCDILKISEEELEFVTGIKDIDEAVSVLKNLYNIKVLNVTAGAEGSYSYYGDLKAFVSSYKFGNTIETTGAGDTFCGSVLNYILEHDIDNLSKEDLVSMLKYANGAAYLVTTRRGAIKSMPDPSQVLEIIGK